MSTNISKQKRSDLICKIGLIKNYIAKAEQDKNTGNLLTYLSELEKEINGKKYGLVFEEHEEEIDQKLKTHTPVLSEEKNLFINNGGQMNFLIEGDNLPALKLLEKTHRGKVDVIYIDPPYNTGNKDFIYSDNYVSVDDEFKHSKWISFIKNRLALAKKILSENGLISISIDSIEIGNLKIICDEIFGEKNFCNIIAWKKTNSPKSQSLSLGNQHEYVLLYSKNIEKIHLNKRIGVLNNKLFSKDDRDGKGKYQTVNIAAAGSQRTEKRRSFEFMGVTDQWLYKYETLEKWSKENKIYKTNGGKLRLKQYLDEALPGTVSDLWIDDEIKPIQGGSNEYVGFLTQKPKSLIKRLMKLGGRKKTIVLDFFAGSGTTGHAVMELNKEDGGNRKFILCTNNENNICKEITYKRIKRVIAKENYQASLKYFKVGFVSIDEQLYYEYADQLLKHIRELVELENGINFEENSKIKIILTDAELAAFSEKEIELKKCQKLYLGHDVLVSGVQEKLFKDHEIEINIIPDYYYKELES